MRQNINDRLLFVIDKNELVVVPTDCQELVFIVLNYPIHELFSLVAQILQDQLHRQSPFVLIHLHKVNTRVRAHHNLVWLQCHLQCEYVTHSIELFTQYYLDKLQVLAHPHELEPTLVLSNN